MEVTKRQILRVLIHTVSQNRARVINALRLSNVDVDDNIRERELLNITMNQLEGGNEKLIHNLGYVLDDTFDMSSLRAENFSGFTITNPDEFDQMNTVTTPTKPASNQTSWWQKNKGNIFSTGASLLGGLFGGGQETTPPTPPASSGGGSAMMMMMQQQQQQAANQAAEDRRRREEESRRRSSNMMIFGIIGGVVVIGGIIAIVVTRK